MARATMTDLITLLRARVGDTDTPAQYTDDALEGYLDRNRIVIRHEMSLVVLYPGPPRIVNGALKSLVYYTEYGPWESDTKAYDGAYALLTPASVNYITGVWEFADEPAWPVYVQGAAYDINLAAAEALEDWATALSRDYDFSSNEQSFSRSQQVKMLRDAARQYRVAGRVQSATKVRIDTQW